MLLRNQEHAAFEAVLLIRDLFGIGMLLDYLPYL